MENASKKVLDVINKRQDPVVGITGSPSTTLDITIDIKEESKAERAFPASSTRDLMASVSNVIAGAGLLAILVVAMAIPLFFWFAKELVALNRHNKKSK